MSNRGESDRELLIRMHEQLQGMSTDIQGSREDIRGLRAEMYDRFVPNDKFEPIRMAFYGVLGLVFAALVTGVLALLMRAP